MRVYLVNIDVWTFPDRGREMLRQTGLEVAGNWMAPPFDRQIETFSPDVVVYAPHRCVDALVLHKKDLLRTPTIMWSLYPDYLTSWDREKNVHEDDFLESVAVLMPYFKRHLAQSVFTKRLLEGRIEGYRFDVCFLGIDLEGIDRCLRDNRTQRSGLTVLWQHRWRTDKNLRGALDVIESLAAKHRGVKFIVGRKEDWDEPFWVPQSLLRRRADEASPLGQRTVHVPV